MIKKVLLFFIVLTCNVLIVSSKESDRDDDVNPSSSSFSLDQLAKLDVLDNKYPINKEPKTSFSVDNQLFSFKNIHNEYPSLEKDIENKSEAQATFSAIIEDEKWVDSFSSEDVQSLPIGIQKEMSNITYQVGFSKAKFTKDYTELTAFVRIILPQTDERGEPIELFFGANNVKLTHDGGLVGESNLVLLGDVFIPFNAGNWLLSLKGGFDMKTGVTQNTTYITIDCDGVKEFSLLGEIQFARKLIVPIDENGNLDTPTRPYTRSDGSKTEIPNRVRGGFSMIASDWNDILVEISLSPFALAKHPDKFQFAVNQAVFDFSDLRSPNVDFPPIYQEKNLFQPSFESWRGIHINALRVALPKEFKTNESVSSGERITFEAYNMVLDDYGISGIFEAENLFPIKSGRTSAKNAWAYSLDRIGIELQANTLTGASFEGQIMLPLSKGGKVTDDKGNEIEQLGLAYAGIISEDEYSLTVATTNALNFDIWKAKARLAENSAIEMRVEDGNFRPKAILHGTIDISASQGNANDVETSDGDELVDFKGIVFQNLQLQTISPIFKADYFGYQGTVGLANFPVSIADIGLVVNDHEASLGFDINLNLMDDVDKGFAASTRLRIVGQFQEKQKRQEWIFKKVDLARINLEANTGAFELNGELFLMNNDPEYGNGFSADLNVKFGALAGGQTEISSKAIFGKSDFRYWYFDASVSLPSVATTNIVSLKGFSGGASYRMVRKGYNSQFSPSGVSFTPSKSTGMGIKAMVLLAIGNDNLINGGAGFEIAFNRSGGVNRMGLYGEVHLMQAFEITNPAAETLNKMQDVYKEDSELEKTLDPFLDKSKEKYPAKVEGEAGINAYVGIDFDFQNKALHGTMDTYINVAGGVLQGRGPGGRSGWAELHISKEDWYVYVGTPSDPQGIKLGVGPISVKTGNYFMVGTKLEDSPPPPQIVADIIGMDINKLDYMRDENALSSGKGLAFGSSFEVDTGDLRFLMFYAKFMAGAGYDVMLRDYGEASCSNTGDQVGINGWYANGQAYAYLQGELGIRVKLFFIKKKIPIIEAAAAILLQAKAPNPIWMRGYLAGRFSVLGGLVSGDFRFKMTLGKECVLDDASPLGGIKMIADLTPKDKASEVDVFAAPQATFSMRVNEPIVIPEDNGDKTYKIILEKFEVRDDKGKRIEGEIEWARTNDRATFFSTDILPPEVNLTATCEVSFQEYINGAFRTIKVDGKKATEVEVKTFVTGEAPNHIPLHNIQYCYPVVEQQFLLPKEHSDGYIHLKRGQDYLFDSVNWKSSMLFENDFEEKELVSMGYDQVENEVQFTLPSLSNKMSYRLLIKSYPKNYKSENTTKERFKSKNAYDEGNEIIMSSKVAENVSKEGVIERLDYSFGTSQYNDFPEKIRKLNIRKNLWGRVSSRAIRLVSKLDTYEGFDLVDIVGTEYTNNQPLIRVEANLSDNYFKKSIDPLIYNDFDPNKGLTVSRDINNLGFRPKKSVLVSATYLTGLEYETEESYRTNYFPYYYNLVDTYELDYLDLYNKVSNAFADGVHVSQEQLKLLGKTFPFMRHGAYQIQTEYVLPGNKKKENKIYEFFNEIK